MMTVTEALRTLDDVDVAGKRVVVRADLNVPLRDGRIVDDSRICHATPTIIELASKGAIVIVLTHFDRPNGKVVPRFSLAPVSGVLERRVQRRVRFVATDWRDGSQVSATSNARPGEVLLMENTRFHPGEEANDPQFARLLAELGDIFVNDAFSVSHRAHASIEGITRLLPAFAGRGMAMEIAALHRVLGDPARPVGAIVGGAKISTKIALLENLVRHVDVLVLGGGMANTFFHARGVGIGRSLHEPELGSFVEKIQTQARTSNCEIVLPVDVVTAKEFASGAPSMIGALSAVPDDGIILDCGPQTVANISARFASLRTLLWNGPIGAFETEPFGAGTFALAQAAAQQTKAGGLLTVAGGGDTAAALTAAGVLHDFSYVSMAGGAFLEWLEGRELPGIVPLNSSRV